MPVDVVCHYFFENGKRLKTYTNREQLTQAFEQALGEKPAVINNYLNAAATLYEKVGKVFLHHSLHLFSTWWHRRTIEAIQHIKSAYLFGTLHDYNHAQFRSKEAVQIFNRFATYNGSNPYKAPAMLSLIPHLEQNQGTFYPTGGMISITTALYKLALKKGVQFHFNKKVTTIVHEQKQVKGIVVDNQNILADVVVSNGDVYYTYKNLLNENVVAHKISKLERSSSALIFYWGIQKEFPELGLHNIFFSSDYKKEFDHLFEKKTLIDDPTVYINITSKMENNHAQEGSENWFVMINAPTNEGQDWKALVRDARKNIISKLNRLLKTDLEKHIISETVMDPVIIEQKTGTYKGSLYGTSSNSKFAAFFRPANFSKDIKGLYFCGGTVHPGGGIPLCLKSALITTDIISSDYATRRK
jgi:phytoene desaturase